ncbi:threonine dehydratase [Ulvibacter sp. MAR_2010_11]|uniref:pyridoxal-phosphate dependent enzyme n=1 Tax=Ulvibacter sp. MAR_2010_11 TaxID=1250229 RepID=UPI000C2C7DDC|nr:pyridoxal-phosphate dependent enzyme [Ulvibacter sp. MAR_2010_11]PKA82398.1 threonine dehydratase [Ulvibacter sp. MAR_2010_11]
MIPKKNEIEAAYLRIQAHVHNTPVLFSSSLNKTIGAEVFFKCENFQKMGAFKMRGAVNAILQLSEKQKQAGVVTHSSGNFGQAVALAARNLGVKAYIVMPSNAPQVKKDAVKGYDGIISESESTIAAREAASEKIIQQTGATFLHPSNNTDVILGNATAALELCNMQPNLNFIIAPVGGGGLLAGTSLASYYFGKNCKTIGAEPMEADDAFRSLQSGRIETNNTANTIADGLKTNLGDINFPIITKLVDEIIRVEESEIISAMRYIWERMKIVIEPSSAVAVAGLFKEKNKFKNKQIGVILSGGNVDLLQLPFGR